MKRTEKQYIEKLESIAEKTLLWCNTAQSFDWVNELRKEISDIFIQQKKGDKIMTTTEKVIAKQDEIIERSKSLFGSTFAFGSFMYLESELSALKAEMEKDHIDKSISVD